MVDGVLFVTTPAIHYAALRTDSGELLWRFDPWQGRRGGG
jgi:glucose dehydrogenase